MKLSARNTLKGTVKVITQGAVNTEVVVELPGGEQITSIVTNSAVTSLELTVGGTAYAVIKASNVMLGSITEQFTIGHDVVLQESFTSRELGDGEPC